MVVDPSQQSFCLMWRSLRWPRRRTQRNEGGLAPIVNGEFRGEDQGMCHGEGGGGGDVRWDSLQGGEQYLVFGVA